MCLQQVPGQKENIVALNNHALNCLSHKSNICRFFGDTSQSVQWSRDLESEQVFMRIRVNNSRVSIVQIPLQGRDEVHPVLIRIFISMVTNS